MKSTPRVRVVALLAGMGATLVCLAAWMASMRWSIGYWSASGNWIGIRAGGIVLAHDPAGSGSAWIATPSTVAINFWFDWYHIPPQYGAFIPLWAPLVPCLAFTAIARHLEIAARRNARLNLCPKCNYNRTGLAAGAVCPECGQASTTS